MMSVTTTSVPNLVQIRPREASAQMGQRYQIIFYLYPFYRELTYRSTRREIVMLDASNDADSQGCACWGIIDTYPHLGGQTPKKPILGA